MDGGSMGDGWLAGFAKVSGTDDPFTFNPERGTDRVTTAVHTRGWLFSTSHLAVEYRRHPLNNKTYQEESLFQPAEAGGLGFRRLSSVIQDRKQSIVDRLRDSPRLVCMAVSEMLKRSRLTRDLSRKVVL